MKDKDEFREKIIDSSRQIFSRFGYKKTTMDEIAQAMNKGKSSLYYYFTSKEDIFEAVVEKEATLLKNEISAAVAKQTNPVEKFKAYVVVRMRKFGEMANFYTAIKSDYMGHLPFIEKIRQKYDKDEMQRVKGILDDGLEKKIFDLQDTELAAVAIVTALKGLEIPLFWSKDQTHLEQRIDNLLHVLFYGLIRR